MTRPGTHDRAPGTTLLKLARALFTEHMLRAVVEPTIADLQCEVAAAGSNRAKRLRARWRGYCAFWTLLLVAPFASGTAPPRTAPSPAFADTTTPLALGSAALTIVFLLSPVLATWIAFVLATGTLFAIAIHAWHQRHPSRIPAPVQRRWRSPQINFSSTEIASNVGGLIFVVGSVFILVVGVPSVLSFLLAGTVAGCFLAWGMVTWHARHPQQDRLKHWIVWR